LAGREIYKRKITIPDATLPGPAQYQVVLDNEFNPLARIMSISIRVYSPPIQFEIKGADARFDHLWNRPSLNSVGRSKGDYHDPTKSKDRYPHRSSRN
jgi:hypothetical protein